MNYQSAAFIAPEMGGPASVLPAGGERPWRIGITGSAGVGKTTLALTVGATLGVPVVVEAMRARLESGFSLRQISQAEHRSLLRQDAGDIIARLAGGGGLVCDRTPLDFLAFWLCTGYGADDVDATAEFHAAVLPAMAHFDLVVVLPWSVLPLVDDGVRFANPWHQLHAQTMIEGLCHRYVPAPALAMMPPGIVDAEARCNWVLRQLAHLPASRSRVG